MTAVTFSRIDLLFVKLNVIYIEMKLNVCSRQASIPVLRDFRLSEQWTSDAAGSLSYAL